MLSRCLRYGRGLRVGGVDINDWPQDNYGHNPLDLATSAGMAFLILYTLCVQLEKNVIACDHIFTIV